MRGMREALHEVTLAIGDRENVAIVGPNGCGKTTLIKTIMRELYPLRIDGASMRIFGESLWNVEELRTRLGIVKNDLLPPSAGAVTSRELVVSSFFGSVGLWNHQRPTAEMWRRADAALDRLGALHLAGRDTDELSSGESRRVQVARALVPEPGTLLLDEPMNNLDLRAQGELRESLRGLARSGIGMVMVTHQVSDILPEMERVVMMRRGWIFRDGAKAELLRAEVLGELFGCAIQVGQRDGYWFAW